VKIVSSARLPSSSPPSALGLDISVWWVRQLQLCFFDRLRRVCQGRAGMDGCRPELGQAIRSVTCIWLWWRPRPGPQYLDYHLTFWSMQHDDDR